MKSKIKATNIQASVSSSVIGSFSGEVLDSNITNKNGLDITAEVMQNVFESEDYKEGIENGWFIGFLGHPEDPDCQDFEHACIVMTEGHIDDDGKCYGTFNLIDTPVGQIVKKFIDAGVTFGISIRGAGDIVGNSVDPETFIFRGFDLVAFPAYPNSIPTFTEIAASTSAEDRKKYQNICAAVMSNLSELNTGASIEVLRSQFAPQSDVYRALTNRAEQLGVNAHSCSAVDAERIQAMTSMYMDAEQRASVLAAENEKLKIQMAQMQSAQRRKIKAIQRITASQRSALTEQLDEVTASRDEAISERDAIMASSRKLKSDLNAAKKNNLIYQRKAESASSDSEHKDERIADLQKQLRETVTASRKAKAAASNRDAELESAQNALIECKKQLRTYQEAYASIYASAMGVNPESISISDSSSVEEVERQIESATNTVNVAVAPDVEMFDFSDEDNGDLITI